MMLQTAMESYAVISKAEEIALVSTNVEKLLGIVAGEEEVELVATSGGDSLEYSKVIGIISPRLGVDIF